MAPTGARGVLRRISSAYARLLDILLVVSVASIILPVTMQIFARFTDFLPRYIWTEELARFLLVWMIMIGSMIGVREGTHFNVDLFFNLRGRTKAAMGHPGRAVRARLRLRLHGLWLGIHRYRLVPHQRARRTAALEHPHGLADRRRDVDHLRR
jgi:hypothetical protein